MNDDSSTIPESIRQRFPYLKPLKRAPSLFTINGFGVSMYGKRDYDRETGTYVKTRCVCALFVPLFPLDAYRVADAESRSWYFLGRESLSNFARSWNAAMGCVLVFAGLAIGWSIHTGTPEYRAQRELKRAGEFLNAGEPVKAAGIYRQQIKGPARAEARNGLKKSIETCLQSEDARNAAAGLRILAGLPANVNQPEPLVPDAFQRGLTVVTRLRAIDPEGALEVLVQAAALDSNNPAIKPLKVDLLKEAILANPDDITHPVELALIYESDDQLDDSVQVLLPYQARLGDSEGARILGQHLLGAGRNEEAYSLLFPYVQARLEQLHGTEASYTNVIARASSRALNDLNQGRASSSWYDKYDKASKAAKEEMVDDYILSRMQSDPACQLVLAQLKEANRIVPVALDLGIVQLNRAQSLTDPTARKAELEAAETTFLAIKGFAGETDEYRLFLGQVYYWLGQSAKGRALFDELLASRQRAYPTLISLSQTLRAVGSRADARALAEEAYQSAKTQDDRFAAAYLRALIYKDIDDQIAWLEKADPKEGYIQIELNCARGKKALQQGEKTQAATFIRTAISGYQKQARSSVSLNNQGLAYFDLYEATGNLDDHKQGLALLEEAILMDPGNSILIHNTMYFLLSKAVMDVVGDSIHPEVFGAQPSIQLLSHLYNNEQERSAVYRQFRENENLKKALAYLDKVLLLSPKGIGPYSTALALHSSFQDAPDLRKLEQRFRTADPDLTELRAETLAAYHGEKDAEQLERFETQRNKYEALLKLPAVQQHAPTLEYVTVALLGVEQNAWAYGGQADSKRMLVAAQAMNRRHQSLASRHALMSVYFFRANEELSHQNQEYAALVEQTRRSVAPQDLIAFILERGGLLAGVTLRNENVLAALALAKQRVEKYPSWVSSDEWALLKTSSPDTAAVVEKEFRESEVSRLSDELEYAFNPLNASSVLEQYWTHKLLGDKERAVAIYRQALREGVPLPPL